MSVINKMLRDLEGRRKQTEKVRNYNPAASAKARLPLKRLTLLCLLLIAAVIWSWITYTSNAATPLPAMAVVPPPTTGSVNTAQRESSEQETREATTSNMNSGIVLRKEDGTPFRISEKVNASATTGTQHRLINENGEEGLVAVGEQQFAVPADNIVAPVSDAKSARPQQTAQPATNTLAAASSTFTDGGDGPLIVFSAPKTEAEKPAALANNKDPAAPTVMTVSKSPIPEVEATLRDEIAKAMQSGDHSEAIRLLTQLSQREPDNIGVRKKLAAVMFAQGQTDKAQLLLEQTLLRVPANTSVRLMLGRLYAQQNMNDLAWDVIRQPEQSSNADFLGFRAGFAQQRQKPEIAINDYSALVVLQPAQTRWWLGLGVAADQLNRNHLAVQAYQKALKLKGLEDDVEVFIRQRISALSE